MTKVVQRRKLNFFEKYYLAETLKGLVVTMRHLLVNLWHMEKLQTMSYPEIREPIPRDYRAKHRLMKRPDGTPRCVACMMCATACPARCITIEATTSPDPRIEKRPAKFEINLFACVFCGYCEEACPVDAIRMDTQQVVVTEYTRDEFVADLPKLLDWNPADYPESDVQSQNAPGGTRNAEARRIWGLEVKNV